MAETKKPTKKKAAVDAVVAEPVAAETAPVEAVATTTETSAPKRRGRPKGSLNKKKPGRPGRKAATVTAKKAEEPAKEAPKARRGRPAGSTNKASAAPKPASAGSAKSAAAPEAWAQEVFNQLIEAQRTWLEMTTQQTTLVLKTVTDVMGMSQAAPTDALADWAKQGAESFIAAQKHWSQVVLQQSSQLLSTVQAGGIPGVGGLAGLGAAQDAAGRGFEMIAGLRTAWLDFAAQQNQQMVSALKQSLNLDDSSPVAALADFAQQTMSSYVEIQKRWLDLATQMPMFGGNRKEK